jgi:hypothetical protein
MGSVRRFAFRVLLTSAAMVLASTAFSGSAFAKGMPAKVNATCDSGVSTATVTVELIGNVISDGQASAPVTVGCAGHAVIHPTSQPANAYQFDIEVTPVTGSPFACAGRSGRGIPQTCSNLASSGIVTLTVT